MYRYYLYYFYVPADYKEPLALTRWLADFPRPATKQYVSLVRRFLEAGQVMDLSAVRSFDLLEHVQSLRGTAIRRKAASALAKFFAYLVNSGDIPSNPAIDLVATLREERAKQSTCQQLVDAGMNHEDAAGLTWRDVARVVLGTDRSSVSSDRMPPSSSEVMLRLTRTLLARLKSCAPESLDNLLNQPIDT